MPFIHGDKEHNKRCDWIPVGRVAFAVSVEVSRIYLALWGWSSGDRPELETWHVVGKGSHRSG